MKAFRKLRPKDLTIGHLRFRVQWSNKAIDKASEAAGFSYAGLSHNGTQRMVMRTDLGPDFEAETLLHEVMHQCLKAAGVDLDADARAGVQEIEERAVASIACLLLSTLRDNPQLVEYLLTRGSLNAA